MIEIRVLVALGGNENGLYSDWNSGYIGIHIYPNSLNYVLKKLCISLCVNYTSIFKKWLRQERECIWLL